jgi:hypothetical protein
MARNITEIKQEITGNFIGNATIMSLYGLTEGKTFDEQFSKVSPESILFYIVAAAIFVLEKLFDTHRSEVEATVADLKPHTARWYMVMSKRFQYGFDLLPESDQFDNTGKTDEDIEASKIVHYAAVSDGDKKVRIKVAKQGAVDLDPLLPAELHAFSAYIKRIKDAGVYTECSSHAAEQLQLKIAIYYNPLVLRNDGKRVDGTNDTPVLTTVRNYLAGIEFDGTIVLAHLVDRLQQVEGIVIPHINSAAYRYGVIDWVDFDVSYRPSAGFARILEGNLMVEYIASDL